MRIRLLVDANNLWQRSIHAAQNSKFGYSANDGALSIAINLLSKYCRRFNPDEILVAWDGGYNYRKAIMPEYKSGRTPSLSPSNTSEFAELLTAAEIHQEFIAGWEADDIIAWVSRDDNSNTHTYILSGDKDLMQLVNDSVSIVRIPSETPMNADDVEEKTGVRPEHYGKYLSLVGDASDGVKGCSGVGPKGALTALSGADWNWDRVLSTLTPERRVEAVKSRAVVDLTSSHIYPEIFSRLQSKPVPMGSKGKFPLTNEVFEFLENRGFASTIEKWESGKLWQSETEVDIWGTFDFS